MMKSVLNELESLSEASYKQFNQKIVPTRQRVLGVRLPALRQIAKRLSADNPFAFISSEKGNIYEMIMLEGLVLSYMDKPFEVLLPLTEQFMEKVDNWAQIDSTIPHYKHVKSDEETVLKIVKKWLRSDKEFVVRSGLVILLSHYVRQAHLNTLFALSSEVKNDAYYVQMGNAWLIATCMVKFPNETLAFLSTNKLDSTTHNKTIQKSIDSFRVRPAHKKMLKTLKIKR